MGFLQFLEFLPLLAFIWLAVETSEISRHMHDPKWQIQESVWGVPHQDLSGDIIPFELRI